MVSFHFGKYEYFTNSQVYIFGFKKYIIRGPKNLLIKIGSL
jgi:hypothetical protein